MREHAVRRGRTGQRAEPTRTDAVLARERLEDGELTVGVTRRVLGDARGERRGQRMLLGEHLREAAHVAGDLAHDLRMAVRRVRVEGIARVSVPGGSDGRGAVGLWLGDARTLRGD